MLVARPISTLSNNALPSTEFKKSSANHRISFHAVPGGCRTKSFAKCGDEPTTGSVTHLRGNVVDALTPREHLE